jgi:putative ABC transport system permease protein
MRVALRSLLKTPGFTAVFVLTLALGIGTSAAVFSVVNAVVLRPLAYPESERLLAMRVGLQMAASKYPSMPINARFYEEWRANCPAFAELALLDRGASTLTGRGEAIRLSAVRASTNVFATLRVTPPLGRVFAADENKPDRNRVAVISHRLWRDRFAGAADIVGRTVMLDQRPFTIVGVLPADFRLPEAKQFSLGNVTPNGEPDVFLPKEYDAKELDEAVGRFNYEVIGRLAPGATAATAVAQMDVIAARLARIEDPGLTIRSLAVPLQEAVTGPARRGLFLLLDAISAVLLIACLNLSVLALARAERRGHDSAVRSALGASRRQLLGQALLESGLLAAAGGALGLVVTYWGLDLLVGLAPADLPRLDEVRLDSRVLGFALAATLGTALLSGLIPAWRTARADAVDALRNGDNRTSTGGRTPRRLRQTLIAVEVGVSTVLLAIAGLLVGSFLRVTTIDGGFRGAGVVTTNVAVASAKYHEDSARLALYQRLVAELATLPGVASAAVTNALPLQGETWVDSLTFLGDTRPWGERPSCNVRFVSEDYFATLGIPVSAGRVFRPEDAKRKVVVLSAGFAAQLWPGQNPVGRKVTRGQNDELEVIGVVGDVRASADQRPVSIAYYPFAAWPPSRAMLAVRLQGNLAALAPALREVIHRTDADIPLQPFQTMDELLQSSVSQRRFQMRLAAAFAVAALVLAGLGTYGVVAHNVTQRTRELGIRMAFGADAGSVLRLIVSQSLRPILFGLAGGLLAALLGGRVLAGLLYETNPRDPLTLALVGATLMLVAFVACWLPARRATKVDPMVALRAE